MSQPTERQPAYDAVYAVIRQYPVTGLAGAMENARLWRAVEAALDAMQPAEHHLPLLDLTADEIDELIVTARVMANTAGGPRLLAALAKLTTSTEETP